MRQWQRFLIIVSLINRFKVHDYLDMIETVRNFAHTKGLHNVPVWADIISPTGETTTFYARLQKIAIGRSRSKNRASLIDVLCRSGRGTGGSFKATLWHTNLST